MCKRRGGIKCAREKEIETEREGKGERLHADVPDSCKSLGGPQGAQIVWTENLSLCPGALEWLKRLNLVGGTSSATIPHLPNCQLVEELHYIWRSGPLHATADLAAVLEKGPGNQHQSKSICSCHKALKTCLQKAHMYTCLYSCVGPTAIVCRKPAMDCVSRYRCFFTF